MGKLVTLGINKWQLEAEGYGPKHYVASNNTEAGPKPLDRRMSDEEANEFWFLVYECISQP
ncbi:hypothetical protein [Spirosoma spitsbergense]|uniref:hypothetical protein n=1 Tax=Spirosoma spitsbergense TaxID=431554 RepID=UPI0012FCD93F|nr:hypothetical protein [Spirosoma spitsbergense]